MPYFANRERELSALERACGHTAGLAVVSGRRRVGKTALLDQFATRWSEASGGRAVFLPGTRAPVAEALRRLEERVRGALPPTAGDLLDLGHFDSWDGALGYLLARAREEAILLILDEFPYLCEAEPALASTLQARWDHRGENRLSLILAGSHVGLMEELVAVDAPLFGRADAHLRVQPFSWREAPLLVGGDDPDAWLEAVLAVGGMPRYLRLWDPAHDALSNLADLLDGPGAPLADEGTVVLQELSPGSAAARVLELVALGATSFTAVRERARLAPATTSEALASLEQLGLLARLTPVGEDPRRTRRVRYRVRDPLLAIWLAVVGPNRDAFELGRGAAVLAANRDRITAVTAEALAAVVADWLATECATTAGPWWGTGGSPGVEVLAVRGRTPIAAAAAHWATGIDAAEPRARVADALRAGGQTVPDDIRVVARSGTGVVTPALLYDDG